MMRMATGSLISGMIGMLKSMIGLTGDRENIILMLTGILPFTSIVNGTTT